MTAEDHELVQFLRYVAGALVVGALLTIGLIVAQGFKDKAAMGRAYAEQVNALNAKERATLHTAEQQIAAAAAEVRAMKLRVFRSDELRKLQAVLATCGTVEP
jgi:hypothetical protein